MRRRFRDVRECRNEMGLSPLAQQARKMEAEGRLSYNNLDDSLAKLLFPELPDDSGNLEDYNALLPDDSGEVFRG